MCSYDAAVTEVPESCTATIPGSEPAYICGNYSVRDYATGVWEYAVVDKVKPATSRSSRSHILYYFLRDNGNVRDTACAL